MIDRPHYNGPISFQCDGCPEVLETHCEDFGGAAAKMKAAGWRPKLDAAGEWSHFCPECSK